MLFTSKYYLFGAAAILSFLLYFLYFGSGNWLTLLLFLFGIMLLVVELFIPDFGLVGVAGFLTYVCSGLCLAGILVWPWERALRHTSRWCVSIRDCGRMIGRASQLYSHGRLTPLRRDSGMLNAEL